MRSVVLLTILLEILMISANALTETGSFANSGLITQTSDFKFVKTSLDSAVSTSDINFGSRGELNAEYALAHEEIYQINQGIWTSLNNSWWYNGQYNFNSSFSGVNVTEGLMRLCGISKTEFSPYRYYPGAISETVALTTSDGHIGNYSAISKTLLDSDISNPIIIDTPNPTYNFRTQGEVGTEFLQTCNGTYQLNQGIATSPDNYFGLYGKGGIYSTFYKGLEGKSGIYNSQHSTFSGGQVTSSKTRSYGNIAVGFPDLKEPDKSEAKTLETNVTSIWSLDMPADLFKQDISLEFRTANGDVAYSGFDVTREVTIGDIDCISEMELVYPEA
ncbi:MAG: hypothetical protein ACE14P_00705 [Methanotrichaceae archaeon]